MLFFWCTTEANGPREEEITDRNSDIQGTNQTHAYTVKEDAALRSTPLNKPHEPQKNYEPACKRTRNLIQFSPKVGIEPSSSSENHCSHRHAECSVHFPAFFLGEREHTLSQTSTREHVGFMHCQISLLIISSKWISYQLR